MRQMALCIPHTDQNAHLLPDPEIQAHCEIEFNDEECAITSERLKMSRATLCNPCTLTASETENLLREQKTIRQTLFLAPAVNGDANATTTALSAVGGGAELAEQGAGMEMKMVGEKNCIRMGPMSAGEGKDEKTDEVEPDLTQDQMKLKHSIGTVKAQFMTAKLRALLDDENEGVLGVQSSTSRSSLAISLAGNKFAMYNYLESFGEDDDEKEEEEEAMTMDIEDVSYVRKPNLALIIEQYEIMQRHPKYTLKQVVMTRRFHLYAHRFANSQYQRTLVYPTLPQPPELYTCEWLRSRTMCMECKEEEPVTEKKRTRTKGHRFIIAADTQFGILMDGFAMESPNWSQEIEISRKCVEQINSMHGEDRPLFVCVCGDLVDTEASFSGAIASWKKVMSGWERNLVFEQQVKDFKRVWARLNPDIALVCLCGNHDVGNRPTRASINHWTSSFGDDYLSFWVNGTFNICLNNCLFSNPTGAQDMFEEQLEWMEEKLVYARENDATHIFVYGHFPWFLRHEEEADDFLTSYSAAPKGWGPSGSSFADSYFTIPYELRKIAMALFKKYDVTACFSGHFHQNVVAQTSWGMPMIVTGPLSMTLNSEIGHELAKGETNGIGMRVVDVGERGEFTHKWMLLDHNKEVYARALERCAKEGICDWETFKELKRKIESGE
eukprot:CAMPEP_0172541216 /NCGR_PEP_ID=MMETSP1067-20121228/12052_1 /TAXON_ID=265564 ORGANISM="Thalassiosira punctigera, Strain Tpunct2005C2" /NCGR_SAMPLE_ID=MMETSP1067 /ASSEMBLY_ACC=CAM_ASM_000444 /LENGTH=667 /DNA_ID=CAMNT_0013327205 /DNA_START=245 /DNA_END=2248 /DNA_ORIENTATION=+